MMRRAPISPLRSGLKSGLGAGLAIGLAGTVAGCEAPLQRGDMAPEARPDYRGVQTHLLDDDLVSFRVEMAGARSREDVDRYAECAAAQYTLIRGFRICPASAHQRGGRGWHLARGCDLHDLAGIAADGVKKLDAEVVAADCAENGIPMV
jgi:hypothetical protein